MIFNVEIKNGNLKLCDSNVPSWPIAAIAFYRRESDSRIRLFRILIDLMSHSLILSMSNLDSAF